MKGLLGCSYQSLFRFASGKAESSSFQLKNLFTFLQVRTTGVSCPGQSWLQSSYPTRVEDRIRGSPGKIIIRMIIMTIMTTKGILPIMTSEMVPF